MKQLPSAEREVTYLPQYVLTPFVPLVFPRSADRRPGCEGVFLEASMQREFWACSSKILRLWGLTDEVRRRGRLDLQELVR